MAKVVLPVGDVPYPVPQREASKVEHELPIYEGFPESEESERKGNLTPMSLPTPQPLTGPGPFKNVRGGR